MVKDDLRVINKVKCKDKIPDEDELYLPTDDKSCDEEKQE